MKDGPIRGALKRAVRWVWTCEMGVRRRFRAVRGTARYRLGGGCGGCAKCCEAPSVRVGAWLWHLPISRRLFLWWQERVNGFQLAQAERATRTFVFRCTHFDGGTRRCDSYATRPFMCRDYPRLLLDQPWPELFDGCGYRAVARDRGGLGAAIEATALSDERKAVLKKKLHLVE